LQIDRILKEVDALIGVPDIKKAMYAIYDTMQANWDIEVSANSGLTPGQMFVNRVYVGNPGTGKTTVAKLYARLLCATGMLSKDEVVSRSASDFISEAVGGSSQKTKDILKLAEGKALFIDEAYALFDGSAQFSSAKSYGSQVYFLDTLRFAQKRVTSSESGSGHNCREGTAAGGPRHNHGWLRGAIGSNVSRVQSRAHQPL
jgi:hypothetical protein